MKGRDTLPPYVLQVVGLVSFLFQMVFWAMTNKVSEVLVAASGSLYSIGLAGEARRMVKGIRRNNEDDKE